MSRKINIHINEMSNLQQIPSILGENGTVGNDEKIDKKLL